MSPRLIQPGARYGASDGVKHRCNRNLSVERPTCQQETGVGWPTIGPYAVLTAEVLGQIITRQIFADIR